jgi:phosphoglucomutase/phosphomannomutase
MEALPPLDPDIQRRVRHWLEGPYDAASKEEVRALAAHDVPGLIDAFYTDVAFGTSGLRNLMGPGTNRINVYTVAAATQGLAHYLLRQEGSPSVLVGFDSRHQSRAFACKTAQVLAGNGIRVFLFRALRPTPFLSFACRAKKCSAAVVITASHNPREYNGYKVYWKDGGQVVEPHDAGIMQEVHAVREVREAPLDSPLIEQIGEELDQPFCDALRPLQIRPEHNRERGSLLKVVYTSLHGTGITLIPAALRDWGFGALSLVEEQVTPDGDFPTVRYPNPEYPEALELGTLRLLREEGDLLIANDPDADRLGAVVRHQGLAYRLSGNELASLFAFYICSQLKEKGRLPSNGVIATTVVSTELLRVLAASYGVHYVEVLTGFKYIAQKIREWEDGSRHFLLGAEESYGYLAGAYTRDKDGIGSACLLCEIALFAKEQGLTLIDLLHAVYRTYGVFREKQCTLDFPGKQGAEQMAAFTRFFRKTPPSTLAGAPVEEMEDLLPGGGKWNLPPSDVLIFRLKGGGKVVLRPSGTEPKIRIYAAVSQPAEPSVAAGIALCEERLSLLTQAVLALWEHRT